MLRTSVQSSADNCTNVLCMLRKNPQPFMDRAMVMGPSGTLTVAGCYCLLAWSDMGTICFSLALTGSHPKGELATYQLNSPTIAECILR